MLKFYYPDEHVKSVFKINYEKLLVKGFKGIIFDIDNTLVHHGADSTEEIDKLFARIHEMGFKTLLLSNNNKERIERFNKNINTLYIDEADKPAQKAYQKAIEMLELDKKEVVCVGDQLFTDVYGANKYGIATILVEIPKELIR